MITLYAYTFRTRAERVLWLLEELGLAYQLIRVSPKDIQAISSQAKVPCLVHEGKVYTESLAIMEYLVSLTDRHDLVPSAAPEVYSFRHCLYYIATEVEPYLWIAEQDSRLKGYYVWPEGTYDESMKRLSKSMAHLYSLVSDSGYITSGFTLADIYAHHIFCWAKMKGLKHPELIEGYLQRLEGRASFPQEVKS